MLLFKYGAENVNGSRQGHERNNLLIFEMSYTNDYRPAGALEKSQKSKLDLIITGETIRLLWLNASLQGH